MAFGFDGTNYTAFVTMSGSQLDAFNTTPFQLIAAPGPNLVVMLRRIQTIFVQTGANFYAQDAGIAMCWDNTPMFDPPDTNGLNPNSTLVGHPIYAVWDAWGRLALFALDIAVGVNQPIKVQSDFDWNTEGQILTSHLTNAGTAYTPGDVSDPTGNGNILIHVDTVTGGPPGPIATYHIVQTPGMLLSVGTNETLGDAGSGDAVLHVDTIQPGTLGTLHFTLEYQILSAV